MVVQYSFNNAGRGYEYSLLQRLFRVVLVLDS